MTTQERIGQLEALLARVKSRTNVERTPGAPIAMSAASPVARAPSPAEAQASRPTPIATAAAVAPVAAPDFDMAPPTASEPYQDEDYGVEVSSEVVEVDIDDEETLGGVPAPAAAAHEADERDSTLVGQREERVPTSSRRPIAMEAQEQIEEAPHTPPPESGKQVAAPGAPVARKSIPTPVPSQPLASGWREPGLAEPPKIPQPAIPAPPPSRLQPPPQGPASAAGVRPDATKPVMPRVAEVAAFSTPAKVWKPETFGDLLSATLEL